MSCNASELRHLCGWRVFSLMLGVAGPGVDRRDLATDSTLARQRSPRYDTGCSRYPRARGRSLGRTPHGYLVRTNRIHRHDQDSGRPHEDRTVPSGHDPSRSRTSARIGIDPDRVPFTVTDRVARDHAVSASAEPAQARRDAVRDILDDLLPRRRDRQCERVKKPAENTCPTKKHDTAQPAAKANCKIKILREVPHQHKRLNSLALQVRDALILITKGRAGGTRTRAPGIMRQVRTERRLGVPAAQTPAASVPRSSVGKALGKIKFFGSPREDPS